MTNNYYIMWTNAEGDPVQVIDIIKQQLTPQEYKGFLKGQILKYRLRAGKKEKEQAMKDIEKAEYYEGLLKTNEGGCYDNKNENNKA